MRIRVCLVALVAGVFIALPSAALAQESDEEPSGAKDEFTEECIHILEDGGSVDDCQEAPNPILPELNEVIWGTLAFLVLFVVMWKFALPPIRTMMANREEHIRGDLERAESAKAESEQVLEEYRVQLADARNEASRIIDEARQSADEVRRDLIARAEADADALRERANEDVRLATERAMSELQGRVGELAIELAEKVVEANLDRDTQMALVESYIAEIGQNRSN